MSRKVYICGMIDQYPAFDKDAEVWVINRAFNRLPDAERADRIFFFDDIHLFDQRRAAGWGEFIEEVNNLPARKVAREVWTEIQDCEAYPYDEVVRYFNGMEYFTCTAAYMIALAIAEGFDHIVLAGMYHAFDSAEYISHVPCINAWCGIAMGMGLHIEPFGNTQVLRPFPWESRHYGYEGNTNATLCLATLSAAYKACYEYPCSWKGPKARDMRPRTDSQQTDTPDQPEEPSCGASA